jgi:hypothetical protein
MGICSLMWAIWNCRNDLVFNKGGNAHFLQVIRMITNWIDKWSYLPPEAQRAHMDSGCNHLETVARGIYILGWRLSRRINDAYVFHFIIISMVDLYAHPVVSMRCSTFKS